MKNRLLCCIGFIMCSYFVAIGQSANIKIKQKKFRTLDKTIISGEVGYLTVLENRMNPKSRKIKVKFVRLRSLSSTPKEPVIYLEGGGSACTWQADNPKYLSDWLPILKISDLILIDQRGTTDRKLIHIKKEGFSEDFFISEASTSTYYKDFCIEALNSFKKKGIDVQGYNIVEHAKDVNEIVHSLGIEKFSIFGFSFGTHIGLTIIKLYEDKIINAVLVSTDGLNQSFNFPSHLDIHFDKIAQLVKKDDSINKAIPNLNTLLNRVMNKLAVEPAEVTVKHPLNKKALKAKIGPFGLALLLRLDIDDRYDLPVIPRLLYSIDNGDYSILQWFAQKRVKYAIGLSGHGLNQGIASGASSERWNRIQVESKESVFGNVVNFPFGVASAVWPEYDLPINTSEAYSSKVRTLFVTGDLDCRTPVEQVNEIRKGFNNSTHLVVKNAGHEQAMWHSKIWSGAIPQFFKGEDVSDVTANYKAIKFIPLTGKNDRHPSLDK